ncbi:MAG: hypothetical protein ACR2NT_12475 [Acidimicrobiia bacterium]
MLAIVALAGCQSDEPDQVKGNAAPMTGSSQFPTDESKTVHRSSGPYWKVVVTVAREENDPRLGEAKQSLTEVGYEPASGGISPNACSDSTIYDQLKLDYNRQYYVVTVMFSTPERAQQFVYAYRDAHEPGVVGTVELDSRCDR